MLMFLALVMPSSMTVPVTEIYTTPGCRYCSRAKGFLKKRGVEYIEKDVVDDASMLNDMIQRAGRATLPQIFIAGEHIGGCSDMLDLHATGSLAARFEAAGITLLDMVDDDPEPPPAAIVPEKQPGRDGGVLNAPIFGQQQQQQQQGTTVATKESGAAAALSNAMQRQMLSLLDEYAKEDGGCDLARLRVSADFAAFLDLAGQLCTLPAAELLGSDAPLDERKAFWINLYNCLVLHSTAVLGAPTDAAERGRYFSGASGAAYNVGGLTFCLDDIEHGVLRGNAPTVGGKVMFGENDDRLPFVLPQLDPRLHFALNCGARSCPPIKVYSTARLEEGLNLATRAFLEGDLAPDVESNALTCTKLLDWYGPDFGADERSRLLRLRDLLPDSKDLRRDLEALAEAETSPSFIFREYDWGSDVDPS